jgi:hypothetical protein
MALGEIILLPVKSWTSFMLCSRQNLRCFRVLFTSRIFAYFLKKKTQEHTAQKHIFGKCFVAIVHNKTAGIVD